MAGAGESGRDLLVWEWHVLTTVVEARSWRTATDQLGLKNKYITQRIVKRLADQLGADRLVTTSGDDVEIVDRYRELVADAGDVLQQLRRLNSAPPDARVYRLRVDCYPAHIEAFVGAAIGRFEAENTQNAREGREPRVRIDVVPLFGSRRSQGGSGMVHDLLERRTDLVIAPFDESDVGEATVWQHDDELDEYGRGNLPKHPLRVRRCHSWALLAAGRDVGRLTNDPKRPAERIPIDALAYDPHKEGPNLLASPYGHRTRELLERCRTVHRRFEVTTTGEETAALVALALHSDRIAIIASDSCGPFPHEDAQADSPALVVGRKDLPRRTSGADQRVQEYLLGGTYGVYWRETSQPQPLVPILRRLARYLARDGGELNARFDKRWGSLPLLPR